MTRPTDRPVTGTGVFTVSGEAQGGFEHNFVFAELLSHNGPAGFGKVPEVKQKIPAQRFFGKCACLCR